MRDIVVGVQNPSYDEGVLEKALDEAVTTSRDVAVLTAWSLPVWYGDVTGFSAAPIPMPSDIAEVAASVAEDLLGKALSLRSGDVHVRSSARAVEGLPGVVLGDASEEAGLVVVGTHGHGPVTSLLLGSCTLQVLHRASCPVMVVPPTAAPGPPRRVVVGVDLTGSESALAWGLDAARRHGCPLHLVHVLAPVPTPIAVPLDLDFPSLDGEITTALLAMLAGAGHAADGISVSTAVLHGPPSAALIDEAGPDDLLVMGSRGRGGFASLVLGSVASQCAQHAQGVVVVVKPGAQRL